VIDVTNQWDSLAGPGDLAARLTIVLRKLDPPVVGIAGPPGSGKTTLARAVVAALGPRAMQLSMDDFYLSRAEREEKGLRFRGGPGSHDLTALVDVLDRVREGRVPITIPRYDTLADDCGTPETIDHVPRPLLLDGYFLGYAGEGYSAVVERLDLLVFLDMDMDTAKRRRFGREQSLRDEGGGLSESDMRSFWDDVLAPGIASLVPPARRAADMVVVVDGAERVISVAVRDERSDVIDAIGERT
jgi:pantothenate kinase-related protein Tda10